MIGTDPSHLPCVADDFHLTKTIPRLEEAVRWRKEMGIDDVASMGQELQDLVSLLPQSVFLIDAIR